MYPISLAHLSQSALDASALLVAEAVPRYKPAERARIAARLRHHVDAGLLRPAVVQKAFQRGVLGSDAALARIGGKLLRKMRALAPVRLVLPVQITAPYDPRYENDDMRAALRLWGATLLEHRVVAPEHVREALGQSAYQLVNVLREACRAYAADQLARTFAACGVPALPQAHATPRWEAMPACLYGITQERDPSSVFLLPDESDSYSSFTANRLSIGMGHPDTGVLCAAIAAFRLRLIYLSAPHQGIDHGVFGGGQMLEDIAAYAGDASQADGSVVLPDDLLEQMEMEYGWERGDPDTIEKLTRCVKFLGAYKSAFPHYKSPRAAIRALRQHAANRPTDHGSAALEGIAALLAFTDRTGRVVVDDLVQEPLDEECYATALHVVTADLTGLEDGMVGDLEQVQMETGSEGGSVISAPDVWKAYELCVREACVITVLSHFLTSYESNHV